MTTPTPDQLIAALAHRYATKKFDTSQKIPAPLWSKLEDTLILSQSALGLQPWHFITVTDPAIKQQLAPHSHHNTAQVLTCSHLLVLALRKDIDAAYLDQYIARICALRQTTPESLAPYRKRLDSFLSATTANNTLNEYNTRQVYIALGQFTTIAALLGIDTCPIGAIDLQQYDSILKLPKHLTTIIACPAGYRSPEDPYATTPKVRFEKSTLTTHL